MLNLEKLTNSIKLCMGRWWNFLFAFEAKQLQIQPKLSTTCRHFKVNKL